MGEGAGVTMGGAKETAKQELEQAKATAQDATETARREAARTRDTVAETVKELKAAVDWVGGPPAADPDQAEQQITALRERLDRDVRTLRSRIPEPSQIDPRSKQVAGGIAAAAALVPVGISALRRRGMRRDQQRRFRDQAIAIARELARLDLEGVLDDVTEELSEERGSSRRGRALLMLIGMVAGLAVTWVARQGEMTGVTRTS